MILPRVLFWFALIGFFVSPVAFLSLGKWSVPLMKKLPIAYVGGCLAFWLNILFAITVVSFVAPFKIKTVVTSCNLESLQEQSATYNRQMVWRKIARVFCWAGDVHFLSRSGLEGLFIPREAFSSREEAKRFCDDAREIWQTALAEKAT